MCKKSFCIGSGITLILLFFCITTFAQDTRNAKEEVPPKVYINTLKKEADAAVRIHLEKITLDPCKTCTSTGVLYIIEGTIKKVYFDKTRKIKRPSIIYTSAADSTFYNYTGDFIVFLNKDSIRDLESYKLVLWAARQATEFQFNKKIESYISSTSK